MPAGEVMSEFVICLCVSPRGKDFTLKQSAFTLQPDTNTPRLPEESAHARKTLPQTQHPAQTMWLSYVCRCVKKHTPTNTHRHRVKANRLYPEVNAKPDHTDETGPAEP